VTPSPSADPAERDLAWKALEKTLDPAGDATLLQDFKVCAATCRAWAWAMHKGIFTRREGAAASEA
jgi:hypothetical protein